MNTILAIPLPLRLAVLFVIGAAVGGIVNWGTYSLAWHRRWISPWSAPPDGASRRPWSDRLPIYGWWRLSREWPVHGHGFWIRPMLVEVATGALFALLYLCETQWQDPLVLGANFVQPRADFLTTNLALAAHLRFLSHAILVSLMLVASLIDVDERTIPDSVTISGAVVALILAAAYPWSLLEAGRWLVANDTAVEFVTLASPEPWPDHLNGPVLAMPLAIGLGCWTLWCVGLMPRYFPLRRGWSLAARIFWHRLRKAAITWLILALWAVGAVGIAAVAWRAPEVHWAGLLTALVGLAAGGGMVWAVRIAGGTALGREAMGFGDVTLLSMIGAFVGWQASLVVFFLAPFAGMVIGVAQRLLHGQRELPYGPYLCAAALAVLLYWTPIWDFTLLYFSMGWLLVAILAGCMVLMFLMLLAYRLVLEALDKGRR